MKTSGRWLILLLTPCFMLGSPPLWAQGNVWTKAGMQQWNVSALAVDPNNPNTIYAGVDGSMYTTSDGAGPIFESSGTGVHVFKTVDGGAIWNEVSNGLPSTPAPPNVSLPIARVGRLVIDPNNSNNVYASILSVYWNSPGWVHDAPPLFKSSDGGANWSRADFGLPGDLFGDFALAVDPKNSNTLYAALGDSSQVYKTTDGGANWIPTVRSPRWGSYDLYNLHATLSVDPHNSDTIYLGLYGAGIFKSIDGGATWAGPITGPLVPSSNPFRGSENALMGVFTLAIHPHNPNTIYAGMTNLCGCMDEPQPTGVWKSTDGGATWNAAKGQLPAVVNSVEMQPVWSLAVHPDSDGVLYAATGGAVFKSTNGGESWSLFRDRFNSTGAPVVGDLILTSTRPSVLYAAAARYGVFKISDWIPVLSLDSQYCTTSPWTMVVSNAAPNSTIRLTGISNGQPWEISDWAKTGADGGYTEHGAFTEQVRGSHTLTVDVGGAHSNAVSFVVSDCNKR